MSLKKTEEKVINFIKENSLINKEDKILVAFSGGPDSVFLLTFLLKYKVKYKIEIGAFHLNHMIRGEAANEDQNFCRSFCEDNNIAFFTSEYDVPSFAKENKMSVEEAGRTLRYKLLNEILLVNDYNKIATGHNLNDNSESVLLNIVKGTGLTGLKGISIQQDNLIRPIIILSKDEILEYLHELNIKYSKDLTNLEVHYERNFIRQSVIPLLKNVNNNLDQGMLNFSNIIKDIDTYLSKNLGSVGEYYYNENEVIHINKSKLLSQDALLQSYLLKNILDAGTSLIMNFRDVFKIKELLEKKRGSIAELQFNLIAVNETDEVLIYHKKNLQSFSAMQIEPGNSIILEDKTLVIEYISKDEVQFSKDKNIEYISADDLEPFFTVRSWEDGDYFYPVNFKGKKKVSDLLNEEKIETIKKENYPVLINKNQIVWVIGLRLDNRFKITDKTKKVVKLCLM